MSSHDFDRPISASELMEVFEQVKSTMVRPNDTRIRRVLSWSEKAQTLHSQEDFDGAFVFFWIAFNALYGVPQPQPPTESDPALIRKFFKELLKLDPYNAVYNVLWARFGDSIRTLANNKYVFNPYWEFTMGRNHELDWQAAMKKSVIRLQDSLARPDRTFNMLNIVFDRLYTLRNQLMHGSSTYHGSVNRQQVIDGSNIMHFLVPQFVSILLKHPEHDWGPVTYPPIAKH